jgi:hypothetical protein
MEIIFRPMAYEPNISPVQKTTGYVLSLEADTISVTANPAAGSPLWEVVSRLNIDQARVHKAAVKSNRYSKIAVLENISPRIILVPRTMGYHDATELIEDLLESARECNSEVINFTHYGLIKVGVPLVEVESIFKRFAKSGFESGIKVIVWDVDIRHIQTFRALHKKHFATPLQ